MQVQFCSTLWSISWLPIVYCRQLTIHVSVNCPQFTAYSLWCHCLNCSWFTTHSLQSPLVFAVSRGWISWLWSMSSSRLESLWAFVIMFSRLDDLYEAYLFYAFESDSILLIFHSPVLRYTSCLSITEPWSTTRASNDIFSPAQYGGSGDWWELSSVQVLDPVKCLLVFLFNVL